MKRLIRMDNEINILNRTGYTPGLTMSRSRSSRLGRVDVVGAIAPPAKSS